MKANMGYTNWGKEPSISRTVFTILKDFVVIISLFSITFMLIGRPVKVSGSSMYPTLIGASNTSGNSGDYLLVKSKLWGDGFKQGDIVVASIPEFKNGENIVKRIIAVEGQLVEFHEDKDGYLHVYVDDVLQEEYFINEPMLSFGTIGEGFSMVVPENCYFLMGDNRNHSTDSRSGEIGMVSEDNILGKVLFVIIPGIDRYIGGTRNWKRVGSVYK